MGLDQRGSRVTITMLETEPHLLSSHYRCFIELSCFYPASSFPRTSSPGRPPILLPVNTWQTHPANLPNVPRRIWLSFRLQLEPIDLVNKFLHYTLTSVNDIYMGRESNYFCVEKISIL